MPGIAYSTTDPFFTLFSINFCEYEICVPYLFKLIAYIEMNNYKEQFVGTGTCKLEGIIPYSLGFTIFLCLLIHIGNGTIYNIYIYIKHRLNPFLNGKLHTTIIIFCPNTFCSFQLEYK